MHCGATGYRISKEWTTAEALAAFEDMISHGISEFDFLGGEPLIREDILELFSYLDENRIGILISTNGLLLNEDSIDFLATLDHLIGVSFSIDGASKEVYETIRGKGNYENLIANAQALVSRKKETGSHFQIGLTCVINKVNAPETDAMVVLADQLDFNTVSFINIGWFGNAEKNKDKLYISPQSEFKAYDRAAHKVTTVNRTRTLQGRKPISFSIDSMPSIWKYTLVQKYPLLSQVSGKFQCQAGIDTFYLDALGVLYPCEAVRIHLKSIESEIGTFVKMSLPEHTFEEVTTSESFTTLVEYVQNKPLLYENVIPCGSCKYADGCSVCPLHAQSEKVVQWCTDDTITCLS
jgi:MoaA/NifB/PqqE/SkfB family radical SAM enzyme